MNPPIGHVHVIEDDIHLLNAMAELLQFDGFEVSQWPHALAFLEAAPVHAQPTVIVTDMRIPGMSGLEFHRRLNASGQAIPLVYISGEASVQQSIHAMKLGAIEFLLKPFSAKSLLDAVKRGLDTDRLWRAQRRAQEILDAKLARLSPREKEVFGLLQKGYNNAEIMQALGLSLPTTKQYKTAVMRKMGVHTLAQLLSLGHPDSP